MKKYTINDISKMSKKELSKEVSRLSKNANRRLKTFEKNNAESPAARSAMQSGGKFGAKGKDLNQLRSEYKRVNAFLNSSTSTLREWKKVKIKTIQSLKNKGININDKSFNNFWKIYEELKILNPELSVREFKYEVLTEIAETMEEENNIDSVIERINNDLDKIYQRNQELNNEWDDLREYFELPFDL